MDITMKVSIGELFDDEAFYELIKGQIDRALVPAEFQIDRMHVEIIGSEPTLQIDISRKTGDKTTGFIADHDIEAGELVRITPNGKVVRL